MLDKGAIYYTHKQYPNKEMFLAVQKTIMESGLPIVSVSLGPVNIGKNIVLDMVPGVITMTKQILIALENSESKYIFFCEHDVFYHPSHFKFTPPRDDTYYYNTNVWRWDFPKDRLITYDGLKSLSGMCCNRELALNHYKKKLELIKEMGWEDGRDPYWARRIGYEPGKSKKRGGFMDEKTDTWHSKYPLIDVRYRGTITKPKVTLDSFKHQPTGWKEIKFNQLKGWELKNLVF